MRDPEVVAALIAAAAAIVVEVIRRVREQRRTARAQRRTEDALRDVLHEIQPNSGSSMHDKVDRIEAATKDLQAKQAQHGERLATVEARVEYGR